MGLETNIDIYVYIVPTGSLNWKWLLFMLFR